MVDPLGERSSQTVALGLTMSSSGASASAATMQRHQEQRRADTSALADAARGQRQMPELPPYVPEFDLAFMSQMLGGEPSGRKQKTQPLATTRRSCRRPP